MDTQVGPEKRNALKSLTVNWENEEMFWLPQGFGYPKGADTHWKHGKMNDILEVEIKKPSFTDLGGIFIIPAIGFCLKWIG